MAGFAPIGSLPVASTPAAGGGTLAVAWTVSPAGVNTGQVVTTWQATASAGTPAYTYSIGTGSLPTGLALNTSTGAITGTVTAANGTSFTFTVHAVDSLGNFGDSAPRTVAVFDAAYATGKLSQAARRFVADHDGWHKPWYPPTRSTRKFASINLAAARDSWSGAEVAHFPDAEGRVSWSGVEVASSYDFYKGDRRLNLYQIHGIIYRPRHHKRQKPVPFGATVSILFPITYPGPPKKVRVKRKTHPPKGIRPPIAATYFAITNARISWVGVEVAHFPDAEGRITWSGVEVAHVPNAEGRLSWSGIEVAHVPNAAARTSWSGVEVASVSDAAGRVSWSGVEVAHMPNGPARISWSGIEIAQPYVIPRRRGLFVTA